MYLNTVELRDVGPIVSLTLNMPLNGGQPQPVCLVGENGAGKTIVLAHVADALMELAALHYADVLPMRGLGHQFFKVTGGTQVRTGSSGSISFLAFSDGDRKFLYLDKAGSLRVEDARLKIADLPESLGSWQPEETFKRAIGDKAALVDIFTSGVYSFFPSSRSEVPHWLNSSETEIVEKFSLKTRFSNRLDTPLVIISSAAENESWLLDVVLDEQLYGESEIWRSANEILQVVLQTPAARFAIGPRLGGPRVSIVQDSRIPGVRSSPLIPSVRNLSEL